MRSVLFLSILNLFISILSHAQSPSDILCGSTDSAADQIVQNMPPVANQGLTEFCSDFSMIDLVNYHNHINANAPYSEHNLISPIDAAAAIFDYEQKYSYPNSHYTAAEMVLSTVRGIDESEMLFTLQANQSFRSLGQIPFHAFDLLNPKDPELDTAKQQFLQMHPDANSNLDVMSLYKQNQDFRNTLVSWKWINTDLYELARKQSDLSNFDSSISDSPNLVRTFGNPEVVVAPFTIHLLETFDKNYFLENLRKALQNKLPVQTSVCLANLPGIPGAQSVDCQHGDHSLIIVGAFYQGGSCKVRLRNSFGTNYQDHGNTEMSVDDFINAAVAEVVQNKKTYAAKWITDWSGVKAISDEENGEHFEGNIIYSEDSDDGVTIKKDGHLTAPGTDVVYKNGKPFQGHVHTQIFYDSSGGHYPDGFAGTQFYQDGKVTKVVKD